MYKETLILDPRRYKRPDLSDRQFDFLESLIPFTQFLQSDLCQKSLAAGIPTKYGLFPSIITAEIITLSSWGEHELAKEKNNLSLLEAPSSWKGKTVQHGGKLYRSYACWLDFFIDLSNEIIFFKKYSYMPILLEKSYEKQLKLISNLHANKEEYYVRLEGVIKDYGIWEYD